MQNTQAAAPQIVVIAGPNGAGKSTVATRLVPPAMAFVNADEIAKTLTAADSASVNVLAGRKMLAQLDTLEARRADFAIETTLASRSLAPRLQRLQASGYLFSLFYIWVPSPELSIARVAERVRRGGHDIPEDVIRRRYKGGLRNFFKIYQPMADRWRLYDNSRLGRSRIIARGTLRVNNAVLWKQLREDTQP